MTIEDWWAAGETVTLTLGATERNVFVRRSGSGRAMTLLHGFPSCSYDWHLVADDLAGQSALLMPDLLGFGASDKPVDHVYSIHEQADLVEALWAVHGITSTVLVAHDYAATVVQELLARRADGRLVVDLDAVHLLNGGIYPDLHRPEPVQTALLDPVRGAAVNASLTPDAVLAALEPTFGGGVDLRDVGAEMWRSNIRGGGPVLHRTIAYITDRRTHERRWVDALETTDTPVSFIWGMRDPISGAHMIERVHERMPTAVITELSDVGHWPAIESPAAVVAAIDGRREPTRA